MFSTSVCALPSHNFCTHWTNFKEIDRSFWSKNNFYGHQHKDRKWEPEAALIRRNAVVWTHRFIGTCITRESTWLRDLIDAWPSEKASTVAEDWPHSPDLWGAGLHWFCSMGNTSYPWEAEKTKVCHQHLQLSEQSGAKRTACWSK